MTHNLSDVFERNSAAGDLNFEDGAVLLIDKPLDWTSFDVVHRVRNELRVKKVGHSGTLDPRASGLLILCTGRKTKQIETFTADDKEYIATMELGSVTDSFDSETPVTVSGDAGNVTIEMLAETLLSMTGRQLQMPPMYSALKYGGQPLYKYARKGKTVVRQPREILINECELLSFAAPLATFRMVCSKGTYVRSFVDECGRKLGCGAYLKELRRTRVGSFRVEQALTVEELCNRIGAMRFAQRNAQ
jgi:tRNA pseudouridine55 synthase